MPAPAGSRRAAGARRRGRGGRGGVPQKYYDCCGRQQDRDPRGYILPSDQPDFLTATKFVNTLLKNAVIVQRATAAFQVGGKTYPAGSYVVKADQAFRPHVMDMFEPQDHPDDFAYPGGPPRPPYDSAGLDAGLPDGRAVRSDARRVRRPVRDDSGRDQAAGRARSRAGARRRPGTC